MYGKVILLYEPVVCMLLLKYCQVCQGSGIDNVTTDGRWQLCNFIGLLIVLIIRIL